VRPFSSRPTLPLKARPLWQQHANPQDRRRILRIVGGTVQTRVVEGCYPQLHLNRTGDFAFGWSFKNLLLGAIWLQMAWLLASGDGARRCKLPDCFRIVAFEPSQPSSNPGSKRTPVGSTRPVRTRCSVPTDTLPSTVTARRRAGLVTFSWFPFLGSRQLQPLGTVFHQQGAKR
jgi:hypothetical protein